MDFQSNGSTAAERVSREMTVAQHGSFYGLRSVQQPRAALLAGVREAGEMRTGTGG